MADANTIDIDGVGPVLFERSKRARRVIISVKPFRGVRVAVPYRVSFSKAEVFVHSKLDWIKKQLEKMKQYEREYDSISRINEVIDKEKAKAVLTRRLQKLAKGNGFSYNRVFIRNQQTRWGSCSSKNDISLNMKLIKLPDELIDYVILHELVHTRKKNHSKAFWAELDKLVGNGKRLSTKLKSYGLRLY
ncbi:M48 family metallopeptidase [Chloroflexota bacterium]